MALAVSTSTNVASQARGGSLALPKPSAPIQNSQNSYDFYSKGNFSKVTTFLKNSHKWCLHGMISALPFTVKLAQNARYYLDSTQYALNKRFEFTSKFFRTVLGGQLLEWENQYVKNGLEFLSTKVAEDVFCETRRKALETTLVGDFEKGTCYGEVAAVMISNQPEMAHASKSVMLGLTKAHIIFFQGMSDLRWLHHSQYTSELAKITQEEERLGKGRQTKSTKGLLSRVQQLKGSFTSYFRKNREQERLELEKLASLKFIEQRVLKGSEVSKGALEQIIQDSSAEILRLTFPHSKDAHTICLFLHPRFQIYDSLMGMVDYETQDKLLIDVIKCFEEVIQLSAKGVKQMTVEAFQRSKSTRS